LAFFGGIVRTKEASPEKPFLRGKNTTCFARNISFIICNKKKKKYQLKKNEEQQFYCNNKKYLALNDPNFDMIV